MDKMEEDDLKSLYFNIHVLSIDHSLNCSEIEKYKDILFSHNSIKQIYFKKNVDLKTIGIIKDLLKISDYIDDSKIEKYILVDLSKEDLLTILNDNYENPRTWQLPYERNENNLKLLDIPMFRTLISFTKLFESNELSSLELVMKVYDVIKLFEFTNSKDNKKLPDVIKLKKANSYELNKLFTYVLNYYGFKTFMGSVKSKEGNNYVSLVDIKDTKYNIDGIYLFDPSMDTLSKSDYNGEAIRRINYNFFGLNLFEMNRLTYDDQLTGVLSIVAIDDYQYSKEKIRNKDNLEQLKEAKEFLKTFNTLYRTIYNRIKDSKSIDIDTIVKVNNVLYKLKQDKRERMDNILIENYKQRREELFLKELDEDIKEDIE